MIGRVQHRSLNVSVSASKTTSLHPYIHIPSSLSLPLPSRLLVEVVHRVVTNRLVRAAPLRYLLEARAGLRRSGAEGSGAEGVICKGGPVAGGAAAAGAI